MKNTFTSFYNKSNTYRLLIFFIFIFQPPSDASNEGWNWLNHLPQNNMNCLKEIPGSHNLIAAGDAGTILISTDYGFTWHVQYIPELQFTTITQIEFIDALTGYLSGGAFIYKTTDGGQSWNRMITGCPYYISLMQFVNDSIGFIAGPGFLSKTVDAGNTWTSLNYPLTQWIDGFAFSNDYIGVIIYSNSELYRTSDGGNTWSLVYTLPYGPTTIEFGSFQFLNDTIVYGTGMKYVAIGSPGEDFTIKSTDGGITWTENHGVYPGSAYQNSFFTSIDTGYVTNIAGVNRTYDGGVTWNSLLNLNGYTTKNIYFPNPDTCLVATSLNPGSLLLSKDKGSTWEALNDSNLNTNTALWFFNDSTGIILQKGLRSNLYFLRTNDKCNSWDTTFIYQYNIFSGYNNEMDCYIQFLNDTSGVAIYDNKIFRTIDAGLSWSGPDTSSLSFTNYNNRIYFTDDSTGYAVNSGNVYKSVDGGKTWFNSAIAGINYSIEFVNDSVGFIGGRAGFYQGRILKTVNRGLSWATSIIVSNNAFESMHFITDSIGLCATYSGFFYKTYDQGQTWIPLVNTNQYVDHIYFTSDSIGYTVGRYGQVMKTTDQGSTWKIQHSKTFNNLSTASFVNDSTGYILGGRSALIYTNDGGGDFCPPASFNVNTFYAHLNDTIRFNFSFPIWMSESSTHFYWLFGDGSSDTTEAPYHIYTTPGDYLVKFTIYYNDCITSSTCIIHVDNLVKTDHVYVNSNMSLFPNPTSGKFIINIDEINPGKIQLFNLSGSLVREIKTSDSSVTYYQMDVSDFPKGMYLLKWISSEKIYVKKLIVQ